MLHKIWICFILVFLLAACNYTLFTQSAEVRGDQKFQMSKQQKLQLSYGYVANNVFVAKCVSCHGTAGRVNLETYQDILQHLGAIKKSVFQTKNMPKRGNLSNEELSILWNWIDIGAPESAGNGQPAPPVEPLMPTYDSISKNIFESKCLSCHSTGNTAARVPLTKDFLLNSPLELVLPGNADESGLVISVERQDAKRMPPTKEGYSPLKIEELKVVREWIMNGAKD